MPTTSRAGGPLEAYADLLGAEAVHHLRMLAGPLRGASILHISITASDTHNARALTATVPLLQDLGLDVRLAVPGRTRDFKQFSTPLVAAIQGDDRVWTPELERAWLRYAEDCASQIGRQADLVIVHDPHFLPLREALSTRPFRRSRWLWHCHLDLRDCEPHVFAMLRDQIHGYAGVAVEFPEFAGYQPLDTVALIPPVIDPRAERNQELSAAVVDPVLHRLGLRPDLPIVVQVSAFDRWDDPQWAVYTYQQAAKAVPDLQLALVWTPDFPEGIGDDPFDCLSQSVHQNPSIHLLRKRDLSEVEINALQGAAAVAVHSGVHRGYSAALLEASWKGRPVMAGGCGALPDQIVHGTTGFVFESFNDAAERIAQLVADPVLADTMGLAGHRLVRQNHLVIRWLEEYLKLMTPAGVMVG
ncbi:MAG: glycosyltransferase [Candidatus Dormibacteraceae bacterium]